MAVDMIAHIIQMKNNNSPCQRNIVVYAPFVATLIFSGLCNIVVCITYDFLQQIAIGQKFKMADLDSYHGLKWHNILYCLSKGLHAERK